MKIFFFLISLGFSRKYPFLTQRVSHTLKHRRHFLYQIFEWFNFSKHCPL
ncbi:hypothetical protein HPHPP25D_0146 [Helicobacter pylori Hp P-25d]|nr:hypothetical protein HPHPP25D_0146 [Helicobacter pylori Hp P-25d]